MGACATAVALIRLAAESVGWLVVAFVLFCTFGTVARDLRRGWRRGAGG